MNKTDENFFQKFTRSLTVENLQERVEWLVFLRWLAGIIVVVSVLAGKAFFNIQQVTIPLVLGVVILIYNAVFQMIRRYFLAHPDTDRSQRDIKRRIALINLQVFMDLIVLAALIYFTGGITNPFIFFFIFHMVISSILLSRRNAYFWAFFTIAMELLLFYLELFHHIPHQPFLPGYPTAMSENGNHVMFILIAFSVTLLITVYFATSIMRPFRKRQLELNELQKRLKRKQNLLEKSNRELSEMDRSKTEFLYRVEHELKAPIAALQSLLSVVIRGYSSVGNEKKQELLGRAENRVTMMKELVVDLLSLSRIKERSFQLHVQTIQLDEIITEVVHDLNTFSKKKVVSITVHIPSSIPAIEGDRLAMTEIIRNLIHNGVKYSFAGEVNVSLTSPDPGSILLEVKDQGIGISEEDLENVFKEFYRTANAKAFDEGTGLGLSLVKRLVEQHGGIITVDSILKKGTTFTVSLPVMVPRKSDTDEFYQMDQLRENQNESVN